MCAVVTQLKLWLPIPGRALDQGWTGLGATWVSGKCPWPWFVIKRKSGGKAWRIVVTGGWLIWPKLTSWAGLSLTVLPLLDSWTWQKCWSKNLDQHRGAKSLCPYESTFGDGSFAAYNSHWRSRCLSKSQKKNRDNGNAALQLWKCWEQWENNTVWGNSAGCSSFGSLFLPYYFILWEENSRSNPCAGDSLGLESMEGFTTSKGVSGWRHQCSASSTWSSREGFMSWEWRIWRDYWQSLCRNKFQILVLVLQLFRQTFSWRTSRITQPSAPPGFLLSRPQELLLKPGGTKPSFFFPNILFRKGKTKIRLITTLRTSSELKRERTGMRYTSCQQFPVKSNIWGTKKRSIVSTHTFCHIFSPKEWMEGLLLKREVWQHMMVLHTNSVVSRLLRDMFFLRHSRSKNTSPNTHLLQFCLQEIIQPPDVSPCCPGEQGGQNLKSSHMGKKAHL